MKKQRSLTEGESKLLRISKLFHEKQLKEGFNWKGFIIATTFELLFALLIYNFDEYGLCLIAKIGIVITPFYMWGLISNYKSDKTESEKVLDLIKIIEGDKGVEVIEYKCTKALLLENYEDEGNCYGLEIGKNKLMFWWDYSFSEEGLLPNTKFDVFINEDLALIFGKRLTILGERFQGINLNPKIKWDKWEMVPGHREIIHSTVNDFLNKIEKNTAANK